MATTKTKPKKRVEPKLPALESDSAAPADKPLPQPARKKIAIVGYAPSRSLAPYDDESWEIWGVNEIYREIPRCSVLFELHDWDWLRGPERNKEHLRTMQEATIPIYMQRHFPEIPRSIALPKAEIEQQFRSEYFTNTISWMVAEALRQQPSHLGIYGCDMALDSEYRGQRPSLEFWLGIAHGWMLAGIIEQLIVPLECDLLKVAFQYGIQTQNQERFGKRINAFIEQQSGRAVQHERNELHNRDMKNQALGAKAAAAMLVKNYFAELDPTNERTRSS